MGPLFLKGFGESTPSEPSNFINSSKRRILITGSEGLIGSSLSYALEIHGCEVVHLDLKLPASKGHGDVCILQNVLDAARCCEGSFTLLPFHGWSGGNGILTFVGEQMPMERLTSCWRHHSRIVSRGCWSLPAERSMANLKNYPPTKTVHIALSTSMAAPKYRRNGAPSWLAKADCRQQSFVCRMSTVQQRIIQTG